MFGSKIALRSLEKEILYYESLPVEKGRILFYGDSMFTRCSSLCCDKYGNPDIEKELLGKDGKPTVLNHGFGGSRAEDQLYYYRRMVLPYEPRALVLSAFGNDYDFGYGLEELMEIKGRIVDYAQRDFPGIPIYICSYKPSPRETGKDVYTMAFARARNAYNDLLDVYCASKPGVTCLRLKEMEFLFNDPKDAGGYENLREDVVCPEDRAHFNALGYRYFFEYLREKLADLL